MATMTFVNLPVKDLGKATEFFSEIGFAFDPQFTVETATRMIISDDTSVMLCAEPTFEGFVSPKNIITGGHDNETARTVAIREGEAINAPALTAMFEQIIANNRAGGWRKLKRES